MTQQLNDNQNDDDYDNTTIIISSNPVTGPVVAQRG
jgi:hypothetical protein